MNGIEQYKQKNLLLPEDGIDFKKIYEILYRHIWVILIAACFGAFVALLNTYRIIPQYQTTGLLQVKSQKANHSSMLSKLGYDSNENSEIDTLEALIRTRYILEPVIIATTLNVTVSPHYFPFFGAWLARQYQGEDLAKPILGLKSYAWGGEQIQVQEFAIPLNDENQSFRLIAGKESTYQLFSSQGKLILNGKVGEKDTSDSYPGISMELSALRAHPGTEFTISHQSPLSLVNNLAHRIQITNVFGNDGAQGTGIFQIQLTDTDPKRAVQTLNTLINYIVSKNIIENSQETQKTLAFLKQRLPEVKNNLTKSEDALNQYHIQNSTLSMAMTQEYIVRQLDVLEETLTKLKSEREELLQIYTPLHPLVIATVNKEAELQKKLAALKKQIRQFPITNQEEINLLREIKIKDAIYSTFLNSKEQLEISHAASSSNILILSDAVPAVGIPVHKLLMVLMGFLMGAFFSSTVVIVKNALVKTIEDSEQIENEFNIAVRAVLPYSRKQKELEKTNKRALQTLGSALSSPLILARQEPDDITIESLRSLRINLHFMKSGVGNHVIALMGSLSDVGKSFVSLNLAQLIADSGKRTLLIDADIRRGRLHHVLHQPKAKGLSEYLEGKCDYEDLVRSIHDNLFFISGGIYTDHPLKLFQSQRFQDLIKKVSQEFEQVIIDTPPILPVSDSVLIAKQSHTKLFVVSSSKDRIQDIKQSLNKARAHGIEIDGIIFNHRKPLMPYGSQYYYRYAYGST